MLCSDTCADLLPPSLQSQLRRDMQHWPLESIDRDVLDRAHAEDATHAAIGIVNGSVLWLAPTNGPRSDLLEAVVSDLVELCEAYPGQVPDVELHIHAEDFPQVPLTVGSAELMRPVFGFFQSGASADILVPDGWFRTLRFDRMLRGVSFYRERYPWAAKLPSALWRGTGFCGPNRWGVCSRYLLAHLTAQNASTASVELDVRMTTYRREHDPFVRPGAPSECQLLPRRPSPLTATPRVPMVEHAASRFLVHVDGFTASSRLASLLATNSAVLKQDSYFWAYYHSLLQPWAHFAPFWADGPHDILPLLHDISRPSRSAQMERMARRASVVAHRWLSRRARSCYWRALLALYSRRLRAPATLGRWPRAQLAAHPVHRRRREWRAEQNGSACADVDDAELGKLLKRLEATLARAALKPVGQAGGRSPSKMVEPTPAGGVLGREHLRFVSEVEARTEPPESDVGAIDGRPRQPPPWRKAGERPRGEAPSAWS